MESGEKYARAHSVLEQSTKALGTKLQDMALGTPESEDQSFDREKRQISLQSTQKSYGHFIRCPI